MTKLEVTLENIANEEEAESNVSAHRTIETV
jgi:hypothetical protein